MAETFQERRQTRPFRILYMPLEGFIHRFVLRIKVAHAAPRPRVFEAPAASPASQKGLPWKCGVTQLDGQNERLFQALRHYQSALRAGTEGAQDEVMAFLEGHMEAHFALEEAYLEQVQFPGLVDHRERHRAFMNQLHAFSARRTRGDAAVGLELTQMLFAWMREHILREDTVWSEFARTKRRCLAKAAALGR